ncbi:MAG: hypothetical protein O9353_08240, partial [Bacteroidia bacterium]|nr:hypothetical protein [Bacteroidia bacterium]
MKHILFIILSAFLFSCHTDVEDGSGILPQDSLAVATATPLAEGTALDSIMVTNELVNAPFHNTDEMIYFRKIMPARTERK